MQGNEDLGWFYEKSTMEHEFEYNSNYEKEEFEHQDELSPISEFVEIGKSKGTLRLVEHYVSTQGEGPRVGKATQFVRFAGCSMRCPGWPCDTPFAVDPKIWGKKGGNYKRTVEELVADIVEKSIETGARNICLTGGEPFLQKQELMDELIKTLVEFDFEVEAFTNGSFVYSTTALMNVQFMMDWKLDGSGEGSSYLTERTINALNLGTGDGIKFVCKDENDFKQAMKVWNILKDEVDSGIIFWVGSAWGVFPESKVVELVLENKLPWRLNVQVHNFIWPANERAR
jgi:7-carboxy-7-deazaguanine synthase